MLKNRSIGFSFIVAVTIWALWHFDIAPLSDEISAFSQSLKCEDEKYMTNCVYENNSITTYKVNIEPGTVVFWYSEGSWPIWKHSDCNVRDRKNWSCWNQHSKYFGFDDGEYSGEAYKYPKVRYVSKTAFWINEFFGPMEAKVSMEDFNKGINNRSHELKK
jgi:hypothetical protein